MNNQLFNPRSHGFHFVNSFTVSPSLVGLPQLVYLHWHMGFCGGMCAGVLNRFNTNTPVPDDTQSPQEGTPIYNELLNRQVRSLSLPIILTIYDWQRAPDTAQWYSLGTSIGCRTKKEWPELQRRLAAGRPTTLILIRVGGYFANPTYNHQVVAYNYAYDPDSGKAAIDIYDPNHPDETPQLTMNLKLPNDRIDARQSSGEKLRGFLINPNGEAAST
jgi:hypothetical protein